MRLLAVCLYDGLKSYGPLVTKLSASPLSLPRLNRLLSPLTMESSASTTRLHLSLLNSVHEDSTANSRVLSTALMLPSPLTLLPRRSPQKVVTDDRHREPWLLLPRLLTSDTCETTPRVGSSWLDGSEATYLSILGMSLQRVPAAALSSNLDYPLDVVPNTLPTPVPNVWICLLLLISSRSLDAVTLLRLLRLRKLVRTRLAIQSVKRPLKLRRLNSFLRTGSPSVRITTPPTSLLLVLNISLVGPVMSFTYLETC